MAAGEAHWQVGIVERHINVLKEMLTRLAYEEKGDLDPHLPPQYAGEAKNTRGIHNGRSPSQCFLGRNLTDELVGGGSLEGISSHQFSDHGRRVTKAEKAFVEIDSRTLDRRAFAQETDLWWKLNKDNWCTTAEGIEGEPPHSYKDWDPLVLCVWNLMNLECPPSFGLFLDERC